MAKRKDRLVADIQETLEVLDDVWNASVASYCQSLLRELEQGGDAVTVRRKFDGLRKFRLTPTAQDGR